MPYGTSFFRLYGTTFILGHMGPCLFLYLIFLTATKFFWPSIFIYSLSNVSRGHGLCWSRLHPSMIVRHPSQEKELGLGLQIILNAPYPKVSSAFNKAYS
jgi:hypothetical protein